MHEDLEPLANLRIGREMDRTAKTVADELPRLNADFARRGLIQSGPFIDAKLKLYLKAAQELCREVANTWRVVLASGLPDYCLRRALPGFLPA